MKYKINILYYIPAIVVILVQLVLIVLNYSDMPAEYVLGYHYGKSDPMPRWTIWLLWGLNVTVCAIIAAAYRFPRMRKNSFRIRMGGHKIVDAEDIMTPRQMEVMYGITTLLISLIFLLIICSALFPAQRIYEILLIVVAGLGLLGSLALAVVLTIKHRQQ